MFKALAEHIEKTLTENMVCNVYYICLNELASCQLHYINKLSVLTCAYSPE